jgi:predicted transcriptional regulator
MTLWGDAGCGKTTLAATAPGNKLFLLFDPDGDQSIRNMPGWQRIDMSGEDSIDIAKEAMKPEPFGIHRILEDQHIDTVIVDSLTKFSEHALRYAVNVSAKSTLLMPGLNGYGARNVCVGSFVSNMLRITKKLNKHLIFITHERDADRNDDGAIIGVSMMLGGQLPNVTSKDISEVWNMRDHGGKRYIAIRPERFRAPMKSRMFDMTSKTNFEWSYNSNTNKGPRIDEWWTTYVDGGYNKLPLPK